MNFRVTVDIVLFTVRELKLKTLIVQRKLEPYRAQWALPGGFVLNGEDLEAAAYRELRTETGVTNCHLEQLYTFGEVDRDPRGRTITVAYMALCPEEETTKAGSDALAAKWTAVSNLPPLAFDHNRIMQTAVARLQGKINYTPLAFSILPPKFTLTEAQHAYEAILDTTLDKRNFRRRVLSLRLVRALKEKKAVGLLRPAQLFEVRKEKHKSTNRC